MPGSFSRRLGTIIDQGITPGLDHALQKRIRLTNSLSLFGAVVMFGSIPFDRLHAPPWMLVEDVVGGLAFLAFPLLMRMGFLTGTRILVLATANLIVLGNAALLGRDSGASMVFIALCAVPFALFDLRDRWALVVAVLVPLACFVVAESDALVRFASVSEDFSAPVYRLYSAGVTLVVLLFSLLQSSLANARAERELRENRETAIQSAKLAALGEMSGNIAHEVNNPLAAIALRTQILLRRTREGGMTPESVLKTAGDIEKTVNRIAKIVEALRTFARDADGDPMQPEPVLHIVTDTVELCAQRFYHHGIALEVSAIPEDLRIQCRAVQVSQILLNLLSNAHDAVEGRAERWVRISAEASSDPTKVNIVVTDSGPGIPPEIRSQIMEPFFTTKGVGKGTGLGLSVSKGLAEAHDGRLHYDAAGRHTRFVLTLSRASAAPPVGRTG